MIRTATASDSAALSKTLARAFLDDPLTAHFFPDETQRAKKLPPMFALLFKLGLPHGACYVTDNYESVALWRPPGQWHLHVWDYIVNAPAMISIFGGGALNIVSTMDRIEKQHPKANHFYLQTVGTDPDKQGKGFGGAIIRHQLAKADAAGVPCYLESSKDTNIPVYQSLGFEVTGEIQIPNGPKLWPMWRKVRA